ncbi:retinoic acid receptor RXR-alpha-B-like isoform X1 [Dreissena polymorpha]|uniref:retinoic acid receptor RXR-alpha-B-like isoform X1 n=1 Tax=Dreissena polymorpha TaxID=45954 RepID=UPI0022651610|nr:retinoic acid receptor RXR-alpha-B-like isoform X1 [Dreissena polymorpha]
MVTRLQMSSYPNMDDDESLSPTDRGSDHNPVSHYQGISMSPDDTSMIQSMKPKLIQVQTENGIQVIYETSNEEIVSSEPCSVTSEDSLHDGGSYHQMCVICGDRGTGFHYSVLSCEGCKGFFKRTVQKNLVYTCKGNGICVVNKSTRNNCQYCRYQKCLQYGMKREAVREDRSPGGKHRTKKPRIEETVSPLSVTGQSGRGLEPEHEEIIEIIVSSDPERVPKRDEANMGKEVSIQELMEYGYLELRYIIEWAKKVPDFRMLAMDDQMSLLKSSFMELSVFRMSFRSLPYHDSLYFAEGVILHKSVSENMGWGHELVQATLEFSSRLKDLNVDKVEFAMMGAIVLTYPDAIGLSDKQKVIKIQTKFLDVLRRYVQSRYLLDKGRFGKLLLRLPTLRTLSAKAAERFLSLTIEGLLPLNELVQEMMC